MKHDLAANFSVPASKLAVINNPVDIDHISHLSRLPCRFPEDAETIPHASGERTIKLVAAGRLVAQKGFDILIDAVAMSGLKRLQVTILGEGPLRASLEDYARQKRVDRQIRLAGFQSNPYAFMARADAFVLSSRFEGFSNVMLEALACGTHVIAVPAPGGTIEIARSTGAVQLASSISAEALSAELVKFAANPMKSKASLDQYGVAAITREYEAILTN